MEHDARTNPRHGQRHLPARRNKLFKVLPTPVNDERRGVVHAVCCVGATPTCMVHGSSRSAHEAQIHVVKNDLTRRCMSGGTRHTKTGGMQLETRARDWHDIQGKYKARRVCDAPKFVSQHQLQMQAGFGASFAYYYIIIIIILFIVVIIVVYIVVIVVVIVVVKEVVNQPFLK